MVKKNKVDKEDPKKEPKAKAYDVLDANGELLGYYADKKVAEGMAGKAKGRKVVPSPAGRKEGDVMEAIAKKKAQLLKELGTGGPAIPGV